MKGRLVTGKRTGTWYCCSVHGGEVPAVEWEATLVVTKGKYGELCDYCYRPANYIVQDPDQRHAKPGFVCGHHAPHLVEEVKGG